RFRMLINLEGAEPHEEDTWLGRRIGLGDAVLHVTKPDARCAITTHDPDTGARDFDTLRTIIGYRGLREGKHADFGVLADVVQPGRIRLGAALTVLNWTPRGRSVSGRGLRAVVVSVAGPPLCD